MPLANEKFANVGAIRTADRTQSDFLNWKTVWWDAANQRERTPQEVEARKRTNPYAGTAARTPSSLEIEMRWRKENQARQAAQQERARQQKLLDGRERKHTEAQCDQANIDFQIESVLENATPAQRGRIAQAVVEAGKSLNDPEAFRFALMELRAQEASSRGDKSCR